MKRSQENGQPERRSARLARTKARVDNSENFKSIRLEDAHFRSGSEDEGITVDQVEVIVTPGPDQAPPAEPEVEEEERGASGDGLSSDESDIMPSTTRLKYSRFKGDGSQDVDDWLTEFKSTAIANQEEPATILRIFQGLLKGEALKWYQDVPDRIKTNWDQLSNLFLRTFRGARREARALSRLSKMTMGKSKSIRCYGQKVKALIQKLTTEISPTVQVEWYVAGFPEKMGFQIRQARPTTLQEAMEAAQNYENSAQSLRKSLKGLEKKERSKSKKKDRRRKKHSDTSETSGSSTSTAGSFVMESSGIDSGPSSGKRSNLELERKGDPEGQSGGRRPEANHEEHSRIIGGHQGKFGGQSEAQKDSAHQSSQRLVYQVWEKWLLCQRVLQGAAKAGAFCRSGIQSILHHSGRRGRTGNQPGLSSTTDVRKR